MNHKGSIQNAKVQWYSTSFIEESRMIVNSQMHYTVISPVETVLLDNT